MSHSTTAAAGASPLLLNVDDTEVARYAKTRTLQHAGFRVVETASGMDALDKVAALQPALVLLDVRLPDISGIEVCKAIKQRWPATVVLQTSATFVSAADRTRGLEGGADSYLIQPIDPDELVAAVRALLRLHAAEESTRLLNDTLERRIEERTQDLMHANASLIQQIAQRERAEAALVHSQKMQAVGQLTGSMAHDFNNILASVTGYIHLVRRMSSDAQQQSMLGKALDAAERGRRLTSRLLAFSRSDDLVTSPVDVRALVAGMLDWLRHTVGSTLQIDIEQAVDGDGDGDADADNSAGANGPGPGLVAVTDGNQLELAILNLAINARDATPAGGRVTVRTSRQQLAQADAELPAGDYVVVSVQDTGSGMTPEVMARVFEPFFTTKPSGRGTGLGLSQVLTLAQLSGGSARVASMPGAGTTVSMWLAAASGVAPTHDVSAVRPAQLVGHGEHVLVIDDELDIRRTLAELLRDNGYQVTTAADGVEGLQIAQNGGFDIVLLDFAMPGLNGLDVARRLRADRPALPILFVSAFADRLPLEAEVPGVKLLLKPFGSKELFAEVRRTLGGFAPAGLSQHLQ